MSRTFKDLRSKNTSDPRDKVYGVYGLLNTEGLPPVNYNRTVRDVYTDITVASIKREHSLRVLCEASLPRLIPNLPSWVPDWTNTSFFQPLRCLHISPRLPVYDFGTYKLSVSGLFVDKMADIAISTSVSTANYRRGWNARTGLDSPAERHAAVIELVRTLQTWIKFGVNTDKDRNGQVSLCMFHDTMLKKLSPYRALLDTLTEETLQTWMHILTAESGELQVLHQHVQTRSGYDPVMKDYVRLFGCSSNTEEWPEELIRRLVVRVHSVQVSTFQHDVSLNTYQRTLFTTCDRYLGVGPRWIQPTDSIAMFAGETVPFVVREAGEHYSLVGPAYIYDMMKEERWDEAKAQMITLV